MSAFPTFMQPRQYIWSHEIVHATAGAVMNWVPLAIGVYKFPGICPLANHPIPIVRAAPYIALHAHDLDEEYDRLEFNSAYPGGECNHMLQYALADKVYFSLVWKAVKKHWRSMLLIDPMSCPYINEAAMTLGEMYESLVR